jgi:hypothetical protein
VGCRVRWRVSLWVAEVWTGECIEYKQMRLRITVLC